MQYLVQTWEHGSLADTEAIDLPDAQAAREIAAQYASQILRDAGAHGFGDDLEVRVSDEAGLLLFTIMIATTDSPAVR